MELSKLSWGSGSTELMELGEVDWGTGSTVLAPVWVQKCPFLTPSPTLLDHSQLPGSQSLFLLHHPTSASNVPS